jgi:hypothetical protein
LSQGFLSCSHAKQFFLSNNLSDQLKDAIYPIAMRSFSSGGGSVVLPMSCSNMSAGNFYAPKEYLLLPDNSAISSTFLSWVNNNQSAKTMFSRLRALPDAALLDLNAEERVLTDRDCFVLDTSNESLIDLRASAYKQNLRFSSSLFLQVTTLWRNRCNLTLDETKQLVRVNALVGNCAYCSVTYLDQGTGSLGSPLATVIANNATIWDAEVDGLDPRLGRVREDTTTIRRRAIRLELIPGTFLAFSFFVFFFFLQYIPCIRRTC